MLYILKRIIKKILRSLGFKLIRTGPPYKSNPYGKVSLETLDCMNKSNGIMHMGLTREQKLKYTIGLGKKLFGLKQFLIFLINWKIIYISMVIKKPFMFCWEIKTM